VWLLWGAIAALVVLAGGTKAVTAAQDSSMKNLPAFNRFDSFFRKYGGISGIPFYVLKAICMNESSLGEAASVKRGIATPSDVEGSKSSDGKSWGIMQMTLPTAGDYDALVTPEKLNNPEYSVMLAARFLKDLYKQWPASLPRREEWIVKSYNQGAGNTRKESRGEISGYAQVYWERFVRNKRILEEKGELT